MCEFVYLGRVFTKDEEMGGDSIICTKSGGKVVVNVLKGINIERSKTGYVCKWIAPHLNASRSRIYQEKH